MEVLTLENYDKLIHPCKELDDTYSPCCFEVDMYSVPEWIRSPQFKLYVLRMQYEYNKYPELSQIITDFPCYTPDEEWVDIAYNYIGECGRTIFDGLSRLGWSYSPTVSTLTNAITKDGFPQFDPQIDVLEGFNCVSSVNDFIRDYEVNIEYDWLEFGKLSNHKLGAYLDFAKKNDIDTSDNALIIRLLEEFEILYDGMIFHEGIVKDGCYELLMLEGYLTQYMHADPVFIYYYIPIIAYHLNVILDRLNQIHNFYKESN